MQFMEKLWKMFKNHMNFDFSCNEKRFQKLANDPRSQHFHIINETMAGVQRTKKEIILNKPIAVGVAILSLSKYHMYNFYYNILKEKYGDNLSLLYTNIDSFVSNVKTDDVYKDFYDLKEYFDFSGYDKNHFCYDTFNKTH